MVIGASSWHSQCSSIVTATLVTAALKHAPAAQVFPVLGFLRCRLVFAVLLGFARKTKVHLVLLQNRSFGSAVLVPAALKTGQKPQNRKTQKACQNTKNPHDAGEHPLHPPNDDVTMP